MAEWQPIETAPKDREILLTDATTAEAYAVAHYDESSEPGREGMPFWFTADGAGYHFEAFTHWMDLPSQPQAQGEIEEPEGR